ncbi:hypothetical protein M9Y10_037633 [Tritrichomonas musculus]|uniref:Uncharacterized protein n=1 Tax=Tritrichomonas musculus TaxID=1915356 RepID=A0ABR2GS37_9EUKA
MSEKQEIMRMISKGMSFEDHQNQLFNALNDLQKKEAEVDDIQRQIKEHFRVIEHLKLDLEYKKSESRAARASLKNTVYIFGMHLDEFIKLDEAI